MKVARLRKLVKRCRHFAVIKSNGLFGDFFGYVGMPNESLRVVLARSKKNALKRYLERYKRIYHHYPDNYMKGLLFHECPKQFGMYCVIDSKDKEQTFYKL